MVSSLLERFIFLTIKSADLFDWEGLPRRRYQVQTSTKNNFLKHLLLRFNWKLPQ